MKLSLLSEGISDGQDIWQLAADIDPTEGKYLQWIIQSIRRGDIDIPEDIDLATTVLKDFDIISPQERADYGYGGYNINYRTFQDLINISNIHRGDQPSKEIRVPAFRGVQEIYSDGVISVLEVSNSISASHLSGDTRWDSDVYEKYHYPRRRSRNNRNDYDWYFRDQPDEEEDDDEEEGYDPKDEYKMSKPVYVIYKHGKKIALAIENSLKDRANNDIYDQDIVEILRKFGVHIAQPKRKKKNKRLLNRDIVIKANEIFKELAKSGAINIDSWGDPHYPDKAYSAVVQEIEKFYGDRKNSRGDDPTYVVWRNWMPGWRRKYEAGSDIPRPKIWGNMSQ